MSFHATKNLSILTFYIEQLTICTVINVTFNLSNMWESPKLVKALKCSINIINDAPGSCLLKKTGYLA